MDRSIQELALGKLGDQVDTVREGTSLQSVLELFIDKRISAVPILDGQGAPFSR